jgi:hypothetical protein
VSNSRAGLYGIISPRTTDDAPDRWCNGECVLTLEANRIDLPWFSTGNADSIETGKDRN